MKLDHVAVGVEDLEKALQLFEKYLGVKVVRKSTIPGTSTNIAFIQEPESRAQLEVIDKKAHGTVTLEHIAFQVENVDVKFAEFKKLGFIVEKEPHDIPAANARSALLRDETGLRFQLIAYQLERNETLS